MSAVCRLDWIGIGCKQNKGTKVSCPPLWETNRLLKRCQVYVRDAWHRTNHNGVCSQSPTSVSNRAVSPNSQGRPEQALFLSDKCLGWCCEVQDKQGSVPLSPCIMGSLTAGSLQQAGKCAGQCSAKQFEFAPGNVAARGYKNPRCQTGKKLKSTNIRALCDIYQISHVLSVVSCVLNIQIYGSYTFNAWIVPTTSEISGPGCCWT